MSSSEPSSTLPNVWVLQTARTGDSAQARALAEALGWPCELKTLRFNPLFNVPNSWLGPRLVSLSSSGAAGLEAPWPDLVIAVARRTVPVARWIRKQSGGRTRLVHLGRPRLASRHFDLVISTPQYAVPDAENVLQLPVPLHGPRVVTDLARWEDRYAHLPRPWTAVMIGGQSWPFKLDAACVGLLADQVNALTSATGSVIVCSSPRTPGSFGPELAENLEANVQVEDWKPNDENPYPALLQLADRFVVTGDSASMLAETSARDKPVYIFDLPRQALSGLTLGAGRTLAALGLLRAPREMRLLHQALIAGGHAANLNDRDPENYSHVSRTDVLRVGADRVRALFD